MRGLGLKSYTDWRAWAKTDARPNDIPAGPAKIYKIGGWVSWGDWLGTDIVWVGKRMFRPFHEARAFVRSLRLKNSQDWKMWAQNKARPEDIPANPFEAYKNKGWVNLGDWLGTGQIATQNRVYRPFRKARAFVHSLGLKNSKDWSVWAKSDMRPEDIPAYPQGIYKGKGWLGFVDWLGKKMRIFTLKFIVHFMRLVSLLVGLD